VPRPSAAPGRVPGTPQPPRRAAAVAGAWGRARRVGAPARVARPAAPVASLPAAGSVKARRSRGPRHSPRRVGASESARGPQGPLGRWALSPCGSFTPLCSPSTDGGGIAPPVGLSLTPSPTAPGVRRSAGPRLVNSARFAPCASRCSLPYASRRLLRSFVAASSSRAAAAALAACCARLARARTKPPRCARLRPTFARPGSGRRRRAE